MREPKAVCASRAIFADASADTLAVLVPIERVEIFRMCLRLPIDHDNIGLQTAIAAEDNGAVFLNLERAISGRHRSRPVSLRK